MTRRLRKSHQPNRAALDVLARIRDIARFEQQMAVTKATIENAETAITDARAAGFEWAEGLASQVAIERARLHQFELDLAEARTAAGLDVDPVHPAIDRHLIDIGLDRLPA